MNIVNIINRFLKYKLSFDKLILDQKGKKKMKMIVLFAQGANNTIFGSEMKRKWERKIS